MMQATPTQMGLLKVMRQQAMRDQDRERAMFKDAAYRAKLEAALQRQAALSDLEQRQQAEAEIQRLSDVYEHRVDHIGEAHVEAAVFMQQQDEARAAQERRLAELNERQEQRFHSALSALKAQKGVAKAQAAAAQQRRVQILRAARDKAQVFTAEQVSRAQAQKRRQSDLARQELERRKRSGNGLAMDFRQTRLHEGQGTPVPQAEPAVVAQPLPDPIESAEELQHRAAMEKRRREAAAAEAEIRARERFFAAQAKLRAEAQKRAVEAELADLAAQRLQAKKQALAAHRLHLRDQRKQQELQRVFEENFLSGTAVMEDDLAPRELPAFLKPVAAGIAGGRPVDTHPQAARVRAPLPPLPPPLPCSTVPEDVIIPRWSKCRTAPLGRQPPPLPLPVPAALSNASPPTPKEEVAVQTDPELLAPAAGKFQQRSVSDHEGLSPEAGHAAASTPTEEENSTARRLAWSDPEYMATPSSTVTVAAVPQPTPSPEPTEPIPSTDRGEGSPHLVPPGKAEVQRPVSSQPLLGAPDTDGDDEADAWGEVEVDRELARMKKELGIEDSDLRSSISSIDSGISVPSFLKDAAVVAIVRQAGRHTGPKAAAARAHAEATGAPAGSKQAEAGGNATTAAGADKSPRAPNASPCQGQGPRTSAADAAAPVSETLVSATAAVSGGGSVGNPAAVSRPQPTSGFADAVAALDALGAILRPASAGSASPAETLDSSILRILDSSPSSTSMPTPQLDATPVAQRAAGTASRPGGAAWHLTHRTPGTPSLPSDVDDMLLLSELDWEELERLAGLRGTDVKTRGFSSPANAAAPTPAGLLGAIAEAPARVGGSGALGAAAVGGFKGFSPSSTFSEISSSVSDESLQRFVAQGILPPEIASLLASTPPPAAEPSRGAQSASAAPVARANRPSSTPGGELAAPQPPSSVAPAAAAILSGAAGASPTSSTISDLAALLGPLGVPIAPASNVSETSLSSLPSYARRDRHSPANPPASGAASFVKPATRGLFTIPESGSISLGDLSVAAPPQSKTGLPPTQPGQSAPAQNLQHHQQQQQQEQLTKQVPQQPQRRESAVAAAAQRGHVLPEPVRLRLSDLNRQLLASVGGAASSRGGSSPGMTSPSGSSRPVKPGPLIITSGTGLELQHRPLHPSPSPMLAPPNMQQTTQPQSHHQQSALGVPGLDASALSVSLSSSVTSLSLSCVSSLSLSPTKQTHQHGAPQLPPGATSVGQRLPAEAAAAAAADTIDTFSTLSSLGQKPGQSSGMPVAAVVASKPNSSGSAISTPVAGASTTSPAAAAATARLNSSPYDLYDKEATRLAELMATINASLRQSAEAVARAGGASSSGTPSSHSGVAASPFTGTTTPSREPHIDPCHQFQHPRHAAGSATGRPATTARPAASSESSASPPSTCGSSWTVSTIPPLSSPQPRPAAALCLGSQSPAAAMLQSARTAAAAAAAAAASTAAVVTTLRNAADTYAITESASSSSSRAAPTAVAALSSGNNSSGAGGGGDGAAAAAAVTAASPSAKRPRDTVADGRTSKVSAGPRMHMPTAASSQCATESGPSCKNSVSAAMGEVAVTVAASCTATGGDGTVCAGSSLQTDHPEQSVPTTPLHPITEASLGHAFADAETGSTSATTPSSVLSNLSSAFAMLRMGAPSEPRPPSDGGPITQPPSGARAHLAHPGSPPPPLPAVSPAPSMPSPPPTPFSPILSESSYSSVSIPSTSPGAALATSLAGLGLRTALQPPPAPGVAQAVHEPKPAEPLPSLSISLSSSDGVSSVAEAIAGILTQRIRGIGGSQTLPAPALQQQQLRQQQQRQDELPGRVHQRKPTPAIANDGSAAGGDSSYAAADSDTPVAGGNGAGNRRGGHSFEVWASLTGQTLTEALEGLSPGEPYEDLLRSSLALSSSSLSSGGALPDDDPQPLLLTMAPSGRLEMSPYDAATQGVLQAEEDKGLESLMSSEQASGRASPEQPAKGDTEGKAPAPAEFQTPVPRSRPSSSAGQILAYVDTALTRLQVTSSAMAVPMGNPPETQQDADTEVMPCGSNREPTFLPSCPANEAHPVATATATGGRSMSARPLPEPAADPTLELCSSTSSDEFGPIMAGLIQNIQRGLAALQAPPLQVLPPPLPAQQLPEQPAADQRDPVRVASGLTGASGPTVSTAAEGPAAAPLEAAASSVPSIPCEDGNDEDGSFHAGVMPWWPKAVAQIPQGLGGQAVERQPAMAEGLPVTVPSEITADARPPSASSSSSSEASTSAARQLRQMPTLSRGIADVAMSNRGGSNTEAWHTGPATIDAAAAAPAAAEAVEAHATATGRRISHASAASSGAASSLTLGPVDSAAVVTWPGHAIAAAPGPAATAAGAYSFLQLPRASMARNRTPPSVQSGAESPTRVPSGSLSPPSASASTVSSLDSLTHALAQYPVFGGATQSPMGSQSSGSSDDGMGGAASGVDMLPYSVIDAGVAVGLEAVTIRPRLPIQYQPSQPQPPAPLLFSSVAPEPWRGAWDLPLQAIPAGPGAFTPDAAGAEMLGLNLEEAAQTHARRGVREPGELLRGAVGHGSIGQDISFGAVSTDGEIDGEFLGGAGDHHGHGPISGLHTGTAHPWQANFQAGTQLETEQGCRFEPEVALEPEPVVSSWAIGGQQLLASVDAPEGGSESSLEPDRRHHQQAPSPLQRRQLWGVQSLTLELPALASDQQPTNGAAVVTAAATHSGPGGAGGAPASASTGVMTDSATPLQTPFSNLRVRLGAGSPHEEQSPVIANRERGDLARQRGADTVGAGPGGGSNSGYVGALSEELLSDLLMWTVSDFFSSPGRGASLEADH